MNGVVTISRLLKIISLFCRIWSLLQGSFAKETYNLKEPTNRSNPKGAFSLATASHIQAHHVAAHHVGSKRPNSVCIQTSVFYPGTRLCLIGTINSELNCISDLN